MWSKSPKNIKEEELLVDAFELIEEVHRYNRLYANRTGKRYNPNMYKFSGLWSNSVSSGWVPFLPKKFIDLFQQFVGPCNIFLDIGSGIGDKLLIAYLLGCRYVVGIELDKEQARTSNELLREFIPQDAFRIIGDCVSSRRSERHLNKADVVYSYGSLNFSAVHRFWQGYLIEMSIGDKIFTVGNDLKEGNLIGTKVDHSTIEGVTFDPHRYPYVTGRTYAAAHYGPGTFSIPEWRFK